MGGRPSPSPLAVKEAWEWYEAAFQVGNQAVERAAYTVATEPDRTRAAVVKALREAGNRENMPHEVQAFSTAADRMEIARYLDERADVIENATDH